MFHNFFCQHIQNFATMSDATNQVADQHAAILRRVFSPQHEFSARFYEASMILLRSKPVGFEQLVR